MNNIMDVGGFSGFETSPVRVSTDHMKGCVPVILIQITCQLEGG